MLVIYYLKENVINVVIMLIALKLFPMFKSINANLVMLKMLMFVKNVRMLMP